MLSGRLPLQRGAMVVLGCFLIFSARTIAAALIQQRPDFTLARNISAQPTARYQPAAPTPLPYDPYAGASVPVRPNQEQLR